MSTTNNKNTQGKLNELEAEYIKMEKTAALVPQLEKQLKDANDKIARLTQEVEENKKAASETASPITREQAMKTAELLTDRGLLRSEQKEAFATSILDDPSQLCESIEKIAEFATATQMGEPGDSGSIKVAEELDPIAKFALS